MLSSDLFICHATGLILYLLKEQNATFDFRCTGCRLFSAYDENRVKLEFIKPSKPRQNSYVEALIERIETRYWKCICLDGYQKSEK